MTKPVLLDLYCGQGGATKGFQDAGFLVVGVDIKSQPHYCGDAFICMDAIEALDLLIMFDKGFITDVEGWDWYLSGFDAFHASPPCQRYSEQTAKKYRGNHPDLIAATRDMLVMTGKPYEIENVEGARFLLHNPVMLCGTMFGLKIWRHRYFETNFPINKLLPPCNHDGYPVLITGTTRRTEKNGGRFEYSAEQCRAASGLTWMTRKGMDEAIPPVYTQWLGTILRHTLDGMK